MLNALLNTKKKQPSQVAFFDICFWQSIKSFQKSFATPNGYYICNALSSVAAKAASLVASAKVGCA